MSLHPDFLAYLQGNNDRLIVALSIWDDIDNDSLLFCDDLTDINTTIDAQSMTFEPRALLVQMPNRNGTGDFSTTAKIDDVDYLVRSYLTNKSYRPIKVKVRLFLESHVYTQTNPQPVQVLDFRAVNVSVDQQEVTLDLKRADLINLKVPGDTYDTKRWPGLA